MKYYKIHEDMDQEGNIMCHSMPNDMMALQTFCVGKKYDSWDGKFSFYYDESEGNRETDFLVNDKGWFVVSDKLREILERMNTEIQFLPIKCDGNLFRWKGCGRMLAIKSQPAKETSDTAKLELYRFIGEGYKAMQDGRTSTLEEVREKVEQRRKERA